MGAEQQQQEREMQDLPEQSQSESTQSKKSEVCLACATVQYQCFCIILLCRKEFTWHCPFTQSFFTLFGLILTKRNIRC